MLTAILILAGLGHSRLDACISRSDTAFDIIPRQRLRAAHADVCDREQGEQAEEEGKGHRGQRGRLADEQEADEFWRGEEVRPIADRSEKRRVTICIALRAASMRFRDGCELLHGVWSQDWVERVHCFRKRRDRVGSPGPKMQLGRHYDDAGSRGFYNVCSGRWTGGDLRPHLGMELVGHSGHGASRLGSKRPAQKFDAKVRDRTPKVPCTLMSRMLDPLFLATTKSSLLGRD